MTDGWPLYKSRLKKAHNHNDIPRIRLT
ncbi:hypothetical protein [Escherichia coli]